MADYKGDSEKLVTSSYLYIEEQNLIKLLRSKFSENKEILDLLGKSSDGKLTFNDIEVASSDISISKKENNATTLESDGVYTNLADYAKTKDLTDNYLDKDTIEKTYIPYEGYTDPTSKEILGDKIKKKTIDYMDLDSIGELDGINLEQKLLSHLSNKRIHNIANLNSITIDNAEWNKGSLENFVVESDGKMGLKHYTEDPLTYVLDSAVFTSKIYDVSQETPFITLEINATYNPYLSNLSIYVRSGTTDTYSADTWTDWVDVTDSKSLSGITTRYIQVKIETQTADRTKNILFEYIQLFYGEDANTEIAQARYRTLTDITYPSLSARLEVMDDDLKEYEELDILVAIDEAVSAWNDLVYPADNMGESS